MPSPPSVPGAFAPPISFGEINQSTLSTTPAAIAAAFTSPPPSIKTLVISRVPSLSMSALKQTRPCFAGTTMTSAPAFFKAAMFSAGACGVTAMMRPAVLSALKTFASVGVRARESRTMRVASLPFRCVRRVVNSGLSRRTVPMPTRIASTSSRI